MASKTLKTHLKNNKSKSSGVKFPVHENYKIAVKIILMKDDITIYYFFYCDVQTSNL